jgi:hypothetical protein
VNSQLSGVVILKLQECIISCPCICGWRALLIYLRYFLLAWLGLLDISAELRLDLLLLLLNF